MLEQMNEGASAVADDANLTVATDPNVIDFAAAREAAEEDARKQAIAEKYQVMAMRDFSEQIMKQPGGYSVWAGRMGYGPVTHEGAAEYRTGWFQALENQQAAATEQAS